THESRMDEYLRSLGFYRKKIAKDGSCLFRAVAEQVRPILILRCKHFLHDFVIFQEPDHPPVNITENGFTKKVRLCFLNGNHYDSVYPQSFEKSAAVCQSILYELLYERVCGVERSVLGSCVKGGKGRDKLDSEECKSSEESDLEEDEFWSSEPREKPTNGMNARPPQRGRGRGYSRGRGRDLLSTKAQKSLNPALYRNVEYDVWLRSKRIQQQRDFCMAAGMQYSVGDKCKVQLNNRFYNAYVQEVSPDNGPVTVFIGELNKQYVFLCLYIQYRPKATASEVIKKGGEKRGSRKKDQKEHISETVKEKPIPASPSPSSAVIVSSDPKKAPSSSQSESAKALGPNQSAPEAIKKTPIPPKASSARSPGSSQFAPVSTSAPSQSISVAGAVSGATPATVQSMPAPKPTQPSSQTVPVPTEVLPIPNLNSQTTQKPSQISSVASQITPVQVPAAIPTQTTLAPSGLVPCASVEPTTSIQTALPASISAPPCIPASAKPVSAPAQVPAPMLEAPDPSSTTLPIDGGSGPPIAEKTVDPHTTVTPIPLSHDPPTSISPSSGPALAPPPDLPQSSFSSSDPPPCETAVPASGVAPAPELPSQPHQLPYPHVQWSQLLQDPVYPGFPKNEKGEVEPVPPYSFSQKGDDLPQDINILRFFFNLGVKAYSQPMFPPIVYLGALNQAYKMHLRGPPPSSDSPANPNVTSWQPENPSPSRNLSSIPDSSLDSNAPVAPVASGSGPVGPIELGAYNDHPVSIPMQLPPRPPMPWPASSGPSTYAGSYPPVQFSAPPYPPPGNQMYPPSSVGYHRMPLPMPLEALNHGPHGRMDFLPFVPQSLDRGQGNGQRSVNPQFGTLQKTAGFPGGQPHLSGGDYKPLDIPVSVATMEHPPFSGHYPVAQPFQIGPLQGDMAGLAPLTNGNLGKQGGVFPKSLHPGPIAEDPSRSIHPYPPKDKWSVEEMEFHNVDLGVNQSFYSQSYRGGGRRGQDDRGGYRGRSHRGWKDYSGRGRQDEQSFYRNYVRRGAGPRVETQLPYL
uniref:OTU deubiquitinase 4 n=1 Tax=Cyprinus carpio TaxID=7962 RepID=A0A8C1NSM6_CYPCA